MTEAMAVYGMVFAKLAIGLLAIILQINLMGKGNLAPTSALDQLQNYVLGGIIGYFIGLYAFEWVQGLIADWGMQTNFDKAKAWFETWGVAVVFLAGFSPIPYKVFTICAGVMQMAFFPFVITAAISRFARFVLVAKLSAWGGEKYAEKIRCSIELIGWGTIIVAVLAYIAYQLFK